MNKLIKIITIIALALITGMIASMSNRDIATIVKGIVTVDDSINEADVIIVYGGGSGRRFKHAAELARAGYASTILVIGTSGEKEFATSIFSSWFKDQEVKVLLAKESYPDTDTSAQFAAAYLEETGAKRAIMVSDDWHLRRISLLMKNYLSSDRALMYSHPASQLVKWWNSDDKVSLIAKECAKVAYCSMMLIV
jgi:uncharacterized SAM-binding protein YcdF (DUF218 family)